MKIVYNNSKNDDLSTCRHVGHVGWDPDKGFDVSDDETFHSSTGVL